MSLCVRFAVTEADWEGPTRAYEGDAGFDLRTTKDQDLWIGERKLFPTGLKLQIPTGWVGLVHSRSGLAINHGVAVLNSPGVIDAGYRGEIFVDLINLGIEKVTFQRGDRIAQLLFAAVPTVFFEEVTELEETVRAANGHGSTGWH